MVIKHTINALKTRPHDERLAFAGMCALFVMVVLTGAWGAVFFRNIQNAAAEEPYQASAQTPANQQAAAASALSSIVQSTITSDPGVQAADDLASTTTDSIDAMSDTLPSTSNGTTNVASELEAALHQ